MKLLSSREWAFLALVFFYSFIPTFGSLLRVVELLGGPAIIPENPRAIAAPLPIFLHILSSFIFCILGAIQFLPSIRQQMIGWHRMLGKLVAVAGIVSALTGFWMTVMFSFPAELQGLLLYWVRFLLSISMFCMIIWAIILVRNGSVEKHSSIMLRAYAVGQGASTQALFGIGWLLATGTEPAGLPRDIMMVSAWCVNLLLAQLLISGTSLLAPGRAANRPAILSLPKPVVEQ